LLIDVQNDFHAGGSLAIPNANEDAARIAHLVRALRPDRIVATLDSHHALHVAHPEFWVHVATGEHPPPFTIITSKELVDGTSWLPRDDLRVPASAVDPTVFGEGDSHEAFLREDAGGSSVLNLREYCIEYCRRLEMQGRFQLCVWPPHCLIGTPGHAVVPEVMNALLDWSRTTGRSVEFVTKGQELLTEMYSAVSADVPINKATAFNRELVRSLLFGDERRVDDAKNNEQGNGNRRRLIVAGQAMSHCVNYTLRDIVEYATADVSPTTEASAPETSSKSGCNGNRTVVTVSNTIYLAIDCASSVPGFEDAAHQLQRDMKDAGVNLVTSSELMKMS
jgi:nicotinamidase-related amidase